MGREDEKNSDMEYMFDIVRTRFGDRLSEKELEEIKKAVDGIGEMTAALRAVELTNGDEPFTRFVPYRKDD